MVTVLDVHSLRSCPCACEGCIYIFSTFYIVQTKYGLDVLTSWHLDCWIKSVWGYLVCSDYQGCVKYQEIKFRGLGHGIKSVWGKRNKDKKTKVWQNVMCVRSSSSERWIYSSCAKYKTRYSTKVWQKWQRINSQSLEDTQVGYISQKIHLG